MFSLKHVMMPTSIHVHVTMHVHDMHNSIVNACDELLIFDLNLEHIRISKV